MKILKDLHTRVFYTILIMVWNFPMISNLICLAVYFWFICLYNFCNIFAVHSFNMLSPLLSQVHISTSSIWWHFSQISKFLLWSRSVSSNIDHRVFVLMVGNVLFGLDGIGTCFSRISKHLTYDCCIYMHTLPICKFRICLAM